MIISNNPIPSTHEFIQLLTHTVDFLNEDALKNPVQYKNLNSDYLEDIVFEVLNLKAAETQFAGSIQLVSGHKFPDIVAQRYFGVEVKGTKSKQWRSTGSSIAEGTRIEGIERIFLLFGKLGHPAGFRFRPYEECLSDITVTHSPRYLVDMNLKKGETIFDKIQIPYDEFRQRKDQITSIRHYYRQKMKPGDSLWWLEEESAKPVNVVIRLWSNLSYEEQEEYRIKAFSFFPEITNKRNDKFARFSLWLATQESIICPNVRDIFTSGGQVEIVHEGATYRVPKIIGHMVRLRSQIKAFLQNVEESELEEYWESLPVSPTNVYQQWVDKVVAHAIAIANAQIPLKQMLLSI